MRKSLRKTVNQKKGQVTASIIIGIFLIAIVLIIIYAGSWTKQGESGEKVVKVYHAQDVEDYVRDCLKTVASEGLVVMGRQGGFISPKNYFPSLYPYSIGYTYFDGKKAFPEISILEKEISAYIKDNLRRECKFGMFENLEISESNKMEAGVSFKDDVLVDVNWRIDVKEGEMVNTFAVYKLELPVRMNKVWEVMDNIISNPQQAESESYIKSLEDMVVSRYGHEGGLQSVYMIRDYKSRIKNKDYYIFAFAVG